VDICIRRRTAWRVVSLWSYEAKRVTVIPSDKRVLLKLRASPAPIALMLMVMACEAPPDWWLRRGMDQESAAHGRNRAAVMEALRSRREVGDHAPDSSARAPGAPGVMRLARPWYSIRAPEAPSSLPLAQQPIWPQAQIVKPPMATLAPRSHSAEDTRLLPNHPIPPYTTIMPSPHPGIRCFPDAAGGQRCFSQP
jgi:hypothetical protein